MTEADALASILQVQDTPVEGENKEVQKAEVETEETEPQIETVETDEIELEAEADDNLFDEEFEADTEDVNDEETAVPLELSDDLEIEYKSDGKMRKLTLGELKRGQAGQDYIQRKMQDVAQLEKELRSAQSEYSDKTQRILELTQQMQEAPVVAPIPPSDELFENDPMAFMRAKINYDKEVGEYNSKVNKLQELHTERQREQEVQLQQYTNDQTKILHEKLPELANPEKEAAYKAKLLEAGEHYGFKAEELQMVRDHRYVLTLNDAMKYRALVNKRKAANTKAGKTTTPTVKAGVKKRPGSIKSKQQDQALQRLKQSGKAEDAVALLLNN
tara:strand:- start:2677 stop:3669 length:993 start_codon:yes stop_codon:yes gene_type:complete